MADLLPVLPGIGPPDGPSRVNTTLEQESGLFKHLFEQRVEWAPSRWFEHSFPQLLDFVRTPALISYMCSIERLIEPEATGVVGGGR
jgi:hypothetical protein